MERHPQMFNAVAAGIKKWLVGVFASAITHTSRAEDRVQAVQWLSDSRDVVASELGPVDKFRKLNSLVNSRTAIVAIAGSIAEAVKNYRKSNMPMSMKIALPATLVALPLVGGQAAGIAALGGAVGVPVLLLIFLGAAGITSIIETVLKSPETHNDIAAVVEMILNDEHMRMLNAELKAAMRAQPDIPMRQPMPADEIAMRKTLIAMDPLDFEKHVMSYFSHAGLRSVVTKPTRDMGVDGVAQHPDGALVVQCKRNAPDNKVGAPMIQQFKGVIEEQKAIRGYFVTTSSFTDMARESATKSDKIILIDMDCLLAWEKFAPTFE